MTDASVTIDGVEHRIKDLSQNARHQVENIQFVEHQLQQLNNELAVSDTARMAYLRALQTEMQKDESGS